MMTYAPRAKIKCGTAHFEVLAENGASVRFGRASSVDHVIAGVLD